MSKWCMKKLENFLGFNLLQTELKKKKKSLETWRFLSSGVGEKEIMVT